MENKIIKIFGYWAIGLLLFVATFIVIRWAVDFATWSALDSGWAQVLGSIAALGVAIYVMGQQNTHSRQLLVDADKIALRRKAAAVSAIVERAMAMTEFAIKRATSPLAEGQTLGNARSSLSGSNRAIAVLMPKIDAIPLHELGSHDMAEGLLHIYGMLNGLHKVFEALSTGDDEWLRPGTLENISRMKLQLAKAEAQFKKGVSEIG